MESFEKFAEGVQLFNYQKLTGPELVAEKLWKERRVKEVSLRARKNDLPRYVTCITRVLGSISIFMKSSLELNKKRRTMPVSKRLQTSIPLIA